MMIKKFNLRITYTNMYKKILKNTKLKIILNKHQKE